MWRRQSVPRARVAVAAMPALALMLAACAPSDPAPLGDEVSASAAPPASQVGAVAPAPLGTAADDLPAAEVALVPPDGSEVTVAVRVAATPDARARGLMGVAELPDGTGMLFVYPDAAAHGGFWMRGTLVPLDIAFAAGGEVVAVATMTPCAADPCPITRPGRPYDAALEVPAGWLAAQGVGPGATLRVRAEEASQ